jgi:hypothetical protein
LYELSIENSLPVLRSIDVINNEKIIYDEIILDEQAYSCETKISGDHNTPFIPYDFAFTKKSSFDDEISSSISFFLAENGNTIISAKIKGNYGEFRTMYYPNLEEIIALIAERNQEQVPFTGIYEFENIEIIKNTIASDSPSRNEKVDNYMNDPAQIINIVFTGIGNLFMYAENREDYDKVFRIYEIGKQGEAIPPRLQDILAAGHIGLISAWYDFQDDYLIYNYDHKSNGELIFKIVYKKQQNG